MCVYFRLLFCNPLSQTAATKPASHIHAHSSGSQRRRGPDWTFGPITPRVLAPVIFYTRKSLSVWLAFATTVESEQSAYRRISSQKKKRLLQARLELNTPTTPNPKTKLIATAEASVRQNLVLRRESLTLKVGTCKKSNLAEDRDVLYRVVLGFVSLRLSGRVNCLVVLFALG